MKKLLSALFVLALCSSVAMATVPDPTKCIVQPADDLHGLVLAPDSPAPIPASIYTVTVRNTDNNPIPNAAVEFLLGTGNRICTTAVHTGSTNGSGIVTITLRGGGCSTGSAVGQVKANGIPIRQYSAVKSPDWDGAAANGAVDLSDFVSYGTSPACHDYNNDTFVDLSDLVLFASAYAPRHSCTLQP